MSDYPMLISNKLHSFRNFRMQRYKNILSSYFLTSRFLWVFLNIGKLSYCRKNFYEKNNGKSGDLDVIILSFYENLEQSPRW